MLNSRFDSHFGAVVYPQSAGLYPCSYVLVVFVIPPGPQQQSSTKVSSVLSLQMTLNAQFSSPEKMDWDQLSWAVVIASSVIKQNLLIKNSSNEVAVHWSQNVQHWMLSKLIFRFLLQVARLGPTPFTSIYLRWTIWTSTWMILIVTPACLWRLALEIHGKIFTVRWVITAALFGACVCIMLFGNITT